MRRDNKAYGASILSRGNLQQTSSAPATGDQLVKPPSPNERRSHTPSPTHTNGYACNAPVKGYIMQNGHLAGADVPNSYQQQQPYVNGYSASAGRNAAVDSDGVNWVQGKFQELVVSHDRNSGTGGQVQQFPPIDSKGKYQCPRCARKFMRKADCIDHKARCIS